jgi:hypothetical protein
MLMPLMFIVAGAFCLIFPRLLTRLYANSILGRRYPVRRRGETLLYYRAFGVVFILFGAYLAFGA